MLRWTRRTACEHVSAQLIGGIVYQPGKREAWLAVVTLIVLPILKLTGML